jgi:hypothetical protein
MFNTMPQIYSTTEMNRAKCLNTVKLVDITEYPIDVRKSSYSRTDDEDWILVSTNRRKKSFIHGGALASDEKN